jgi:hypothetical protein
LLTVSRIRTKGDVEAVWAANHQYKRWKVQLAQSILTRDHLETVRISRNMLKLRSEILEKYDVIL